MEENNSAQLSYKTGSPPPYHVFKIHEEYFLFDTHSRRVYNIEEVFFHFLNLRLSHTTEETIHLLEEMHCFPSERIAACEALFTQLVENGILDITEYSINTEALTKAFDFFQKKGVARAEILLAESCNLACQYCFCRENNYKYNRLMSRETAAKVIDKLFEWSLNHKQLGINFFGGEPLLNIPVLKFCLEYASNKAGLLNKKIRFSMTTNATLVTEEVLQLIKQYKIGIMVSLDGPKEIHDKQCPTQNGKGSYDTAIANIDKIMKVASDVSVRCTLTHPMTDLSRLIDFFKQRKFSRIVIEPALNSELATSPVDMDIADIQSLIAQERDELLQILPLMLNDKKPQRFIYDMELKIFSSPQAVSASESASPVFCHAGGSNICFDSEGKVFPCSKFVGLHNYSMGDISGELDHSVFKRLWDDFSVIRNNFCSSCWAFAICPGICPSEFISEAGVLNSKRQSLRCARTLAKIENAAYLYFKLCKILSAKRC